MKYKKKSGMSLFEQENTMESLSKIDFMERSMKGLFFRGVGMVRATFYIGFTNLVYNMCRLVQIKRYHPDWIIN